MEISCNHDDDFKVRYNFINKINIFSILQNHGCLSKNLAFNSFFFIDKRMVIFIRMRTKCFCYRHGINTHKHTSRHVAYKLYKLLHKNHKSCIRPILIKNHTHKHTMLDKLFFSDILRSLHESFFYRLLCVYA
jgi:hypothetical protein